MPSRFWKASGNALLPGSNFLSAGGASWTPASLSGLAGWYDADQQTESNGAAVATLVDRSGNGKDFTQATGANQPLLRYAAINGKKAVDFDGLSSNMTNSGLLNGATAGAWFAVIQADSDAGDGAIIDGFGAGDNHHPFTDGVIYDGFCTSARKTCGNPTPSLTSTALIGAISGSGDYRFLVNGAVLFSTATNTVSVGTGTRYVGLNPSVSSLWPGLIAELIVLSSVPSSTDLANLKSYVNAKFATSF